MTDRSIYNIIIKDDLSPKVVAALLDAYCWFKLQPKANIKVLSIHCSSSGGYRELMLNACHLIYKINRIGNMHTFGINCGWAYSAACEILMSCQYRCKLPYSEYMIHPYNIDYITTNKEDLEDVEFYTEECNKLLKKYKFLSKKDREKAKTAKGLFVSDNEKCRKMGLTNCDMKDYYEIGGTR